MSKSHGILLGLPKPEGTVPAGETLKGLAHIEARLDSDPGPAAESWGALTCGRALTSLCSRCGGGVSLLCPAMVSQVPDSGLLPRGTQGGLSVKCLHLVSQ